MEKRVAIRILFDKLDITKLAELVTAIEALAEEFGVPQIEASILPEIPRPS